MKLALTIALVGVLVGVVAEAKFSHPRRWSSNVEQDEWEQEEGQVEIKPHFYRCVVPCSAPPSGGDDSPPPEYHHHWVPHGHHRGHHGHGGKPHHHRKRPPHHHVPKPHHAKKWHHRVSHRPQVVFGGVGAVGAKRHEEDFDAGVHSGLKASDHTRLEGHKSFQASDKKEFNAGFDNNDVNENEVVHRHKVFNKDKFTSKESDRGSDDVDEFRNFSDQSNSGNVGASENKFVCGSSGGSFSNDKDFEKDFDAGVHADSRDEAVGAFGAGVGKFQA